MQKITDWFSPDTRPVRVGWYHTSAYEADPTGKALQESAFNWWWDGRFWKMNPADVKSDLQRRYWRGKQMKFAQCLSADFNAIYDLLKVMDAAGFTQAECNNDRMRKAVLSLLIKPTLHTIFVENIETNAKNTLPGLLAHAQTLLEVL